MSFADQSQAFFDELSAILRARQSDRDSVVDRHTDRPYSSLLVDDELPVESDPPVAAEDDIEVLTRRPTPLT
jgi:hypothetical protein